VLSGGVWQNITLLEKTVKLLADHHYSTYYHHLVPTNDGGISLGQAAIASQKVISGMI
jgi:hydrogenase maturation protein HypF